MMQTFLAIWESLAAVVRSAPAQVAIAAPAPAAIQAARELRQELAAALAAAP